MVRVLGKSLCGGGTAPLATSLRPGCRDTWFVAEPGSARSPGSGPMANGVVPAHNGGIRLSTYSDAKVGNGAGVRPGRPDLPVDAVADATAVLTSRPASDDRCRSRERPTR